jgi:4-hydroxy-3-polyprenylbenzoate decarboxylase
MYRIQLSGNEYLPDEVGLHYQIHRGIGVHHQQHLAKGKDFPVTIAVGGHPAYAMAAVMPLPEGLPEAALAGALSGASFRYAYWRQHLIPAQVDFALVGSVSVHQLKPEGPFGDHLGYYSLTHDFPVLKLDKVFHRNGAIWPFTVVGRPPQEDSFFGSMIHKLTEPMVRHITSGLRDLHAVDEAGVHPLLLAIGSERYVPYDNRQPREILTQANAILGFGQCSLAKFLLITAHEDDPKLKAHDTFAFFQHLLERVDWRRDLHFQTQTTMDTLDYSGTALNTGSKVVIAAAGAKIRDLATHTDSLELPSPWVHSAVVAPGILALSGPKFGSQDQNDQDRQTLVNYLVGIRERIQGFPLVVLCDEASSLKGNFKEFLWQGFTRANPSHDIEGVASFSRHKHWGCDGALLLDGRSKPHHAPTLEEDPHTALKIQRFFRSGAVLAPWSHAL